MSTDSDTFVYVLRCNAPNMDSYGGFRWPESGPVEAPDWKPTRGCGNGLHGWLHGEGDVTVSIHHEDPDARWLIVKVASGDIVDLGGKVKFPRGTVEYVGSRDDAVRRIQELAPGRAVIYGIATAGDYGTATAGYRGTATAGGYGIATAGYRGTATAGDGGTIVVRWYDGRRYRLAVGYVGEDGILPNVPYVVRDGRLVPRTI